MYLTPHSKPPPKEKKNFSPSLTTNHLPTTPSHAFHSQIPTPPVAQRVSRFTRINGRLGALHPRKRRPRTRACEGSGPPSWLAKKGVCGSGAGVLVMGCIRHCAILESNAGTVSWCFDFLTFFDTWRSGRCTEEVFFLLLLFILVFLCFALGKACVMWFWEVGGEGCNTVEAWASVRDPTEKDGR